MGRIYETYVKRALDVALSGCALAVLSPGHGRDGAARAPKARQPGDFLSGAAG